MIPMRAEDDEREYFDSRRASPGPATRAVQGSVLMWRLILLTCFWSCAAVGPTDDDTIIRPTSKPRFQVVDGETVRFGSQFVRLFGIDAPKKGETCDDGQWHPAPLAKKALEDFIAGRPVICKQVDFDTGNKRPVAQCFAGDDDLQALMVSAGWARSVGRYRDRYAPEEREAVGRKLGMHGHRCLPPSEWRAQRRDGNGQ
jgi:endonuclease YncB( thermonuclease family)